MSAAEQWIDEQADVAEIDGEVVHAAVTVDLDVDSRVTIRRLATNPDRPQGLALDADAPLAVNGHEDTRLVLWDHSAPDEVVVDAPAGRLTIWNVWQTDGAVHAWIGAAGIRLLADDDTDDLVVLEASDGFGERSADLVVELQIDAG